MRNNKTKRKKYKARKKTKRFKRQYGGTVTSLTDSYQTQDLPPSLYSENLSSGIDSSESMHGFRPIIGYNPIQNQNESYLSSSDNPIRNPDSSESFGSNLRINRPSQANPHTRLSRWQSPEQQNQDSSGSSGLSGLSGLSLPELGSSSSNLFDSDLSTQSLSQLQSPEQYQKNLRNQTCDKYIETINNALKDIIISFNN